MREWDLCTGTAGDSKLAVPVRPHTDSFPHHSLLLPENKNVSLPNSAPAESNFHLCAIVP